MQEYYLHVRKIMDLRVRVLVPDEWSTRDAVAAAPALNPDIDWLSSHQCLLTLDCSVEEPAPDPRLPLAGPLFVLDVEDLPPGHALAPAAPPQPHRIMVYTGPPEPLVLEWIGPDGSPVAFDAVDLGHIAAGLLVDGVPSDAGLCVWTGTMRLDRTVVRGEATLAAEGAWRKATPTEVAALAVGGLRVLWGAPRAAEGDC